MMKKAFLFFTLVFMLVTTAYSQTGSITNVQVAQRTDGSGIVDIYFDLAGEEPNYFISVAVSFDSGAVFTPIPPYFLSGDAGWTTPGNYRHVLWEGKQSFPETYSTKTQLQITAYAAMYAPCPGMPSFTDSRDGQTYNTVQIGDQCWMKENLNYNTGGSWCYENQSINCDIYGRLYTWSAALSACPEGWHLPTDAEWCILEQEVDPTITCSSTGYRGVDGGGKLKEAGTTHWNSPNTGATNESGFTALPGGSRNLSGTFNYVDYYGYFWSSTEYSSSHAWLRQLYYNYAYVYRSNYNKDYGYSVRCLRD